MKKNLIFLSVILSCSFSLLSASGIFVTPGSRANSMGGAYAGIADDLTAIYWNPAGLVQLDGSGVRLYSLYGTPKAKSNCSLKNVISPDQDDGDFPVLNLYAYLNTLNPLIPANVEPGEFQSKELELESLLPFAAGYTKLKDITLALGVYAIGGGGGSWKDSVPGTLFPTDTINASVDGIFGFIVSNISAAKAINHKLSVGVGINWINMIDTKKIEKEYQKSSLSSLSDYSITTEYNASGSGLEILGGALYKPVSRIKVGFVVRTGATLILNGSIKQKTSGISGLTGGLVPDSDYKTDYEQNYAYPMTCGFGVSYDPVDALTVAAGADINNYTVLKNDIDFEDEKEFADIDEKANWKNTTQLHFGAEYRFNDRLSLRGGVQNDSVPCKVDKLTLLNINQYALILLNLGAGYSIGTLQIDFNYTKAISDKPEKEERTYEYVSGTYQLGISYKF